MALVAPGSAAALSSQLAKVAACPPMPPSGTWTGTAVSSTSDAWAGAPHPAFSGSSIWSGQLVFGQPTAGVARVTGTLSMAGAGAFTNRPVTGSVRCSAVNLGVNEWVLEGALAANGRSANGDYTRPGDAGTWSGAYTPAPTFRVAVTPAANLLNGQHVTVSGLNVTPSAQVTAYECPATAPVSSECDERPSAGAIANPSGTFTLTRTVYRVLVTPSGAVDCASAACVIRAENVGFTTEAAAAPISFAEAVATCKHGHLCSATATAASSLTAPGLTTQVRGQPSASNGSVLLDIYPGTLPCPGTQTLVTPIADIIDSGFAANDPLTVTATLPLTTATAPQDVCFQSTVPFRSKANPTTAKAGTAFLLQCSATANRAPCIQSSRQVGSDEIVKLVIPGGDPRFAIVAPHGRRLWYSSIAPGKVGSQFSGRLCTTGGKAPVHWRIASGALPPGLKLNATSGAITGTPTRQGSFRAVLHATDGEDPPQTASITLPITIK